MNTCEEHDNCVVVYTGRECPLCDVEKETDELTLELSAAQDKIDDLETRA